MKDADEKTHLMLTSYRRSDRMFGLGRVHCSVDVAGRRAVARGDWGYGADASWSSIGQPLASRPTGEVEPEIRWEGAPKGEEPSWFL